MITRDMAKASYKPVGQCIYCSKANDLRNEHILPYGLSGAAVLPKATCGDCARITARLEEMVLRGPMWPVRIFRNLKSRTKHKDAPATLPIRVVRSGEEASINLPVDEYPILLMFPIFAPPAALVAYAYRGGIIPVECATVSFGPRPEDVRAALGVDQLKIDQEYSVAEFARAIAKIAYAFAFAEGAIEALGAPSPVIPAILGQSEDIGRWVGTLAGPKAHPDQLHRIVLHHNAGWLIGEVQLLADSETPSYGVILGRLKA